MYNFGGGGTEIITGIANENLPSHTENIVTMKKFCSAENLQIFQGL